MGTETKTKTKDRWYVCTDLKRNGGKVIKTCYDRLLGPFDTRDEALACREGFEAGAHRNGAYSVDNWADPN